MLRRLTVFGGISLLTLAVVGIASAQTADDLLSDQVLHELRLTIHPTDWKRLHEDFRENTYYPCELRWGKSLVRNIAIRSRGGGSRNEQKPSFRVDFNRYAPNQEFLGLKSLVLDNMAQDPSMLKEALSMKFFQRIGIPAPRVAYARLHVNNEYVGLYGMVESVDKKFLARHFGEDDGYLYEYRWSQPYDFGYLGDDFSQYAALFDPKTREKESPESLYAPIEALIRRLNELEGSDFGAALGEYLDLAQVMTYVGVENFIAEWDGMVGYDGTNNFYLYRSVHTNRFHFIPKDKDYTFYQIEHPLFHNLDRNVLTHRSLALPELQHVYVETILRCALLAALPEEPAPTSRRAQTSGRITDADGPGDTPPPPPPPTNDPKPPPPPDEGPEDPENGRIGWLEQEIERLYQQIRTAAHADPVKPYSEGDFEGAVAELLRFARHRSEWVVREVDALTRGRGVR